LDVGWITKILPKKKLYVKYLKNPNAENKQKFTAYRNKFKSIRINAERNFYAAEFCKYHNDLKMTWKLIRSAMHLDNMHPKIDHLVINGTKTDNADLIADSFNNYFLNIANDLAIKLQDSPCSFEDYLPPSNLNSMGLTLTTPEEIMITGKNFKKTY